MEADVVEKRRGTLKLPPLGIEPKTIRFALNKPFFCRKFKNQKENTKKKKEKKFFFFCVCVV